MTKLTFKSVIFKSFNKSILFYFIFFFFSIFLWYLNFLHNTIIYKRLLSIKCYLDNKESSKRKLVKEYIKIFLEKKKKKRDIMVVNVSKISQKMKIKILLSIENNIIEWEKMSFCDYNKVFWFRKSIKFFPFQASELPSWNIRILFRFSASWNIKNFFEVSVLRNIRKNFYFKKI